MMNTATLLSLSLIFAVYPSAQAGTCNILGMKDEYGTYNIKMPINDTHRGVVAVLQTENTLRMRVQDVDYLDAAWENQTLTLFTTDRFAVFERENAYTQNPKISVDIDAVCSKDTESDLTFRVSVIDNNNFSPVLNRKRYDYSFGMAVPEKLELTELIPIRAADYDITNDVVFFEIEDNEYLSLVRTGKPTYYKSKEYSTKLTTIANISAPFHRVFNLTVLDEGHPVRKTIVPLTITVSTPEELAAKQRISGKIESKAAHPPVFEKHLYFADYSPEHEFKLEEPVFVKFADANTQLTQTEYEKHFRVRFEDAAMGKIAVDKVHPLPETTLERSSFISFEIEAENEGFSHMPGRTALLIRLPNLRKNSSSESGKGCEVTINYGYLEGNVTFPLTLFLLAVFCIVFINIFVAVMFVFKQREPQKNKERVCSY